MRGTSTETPAGATRAASAMPCVAATAPRCMAKDCTAAPTCRLVLYIPAMRRGTAPAQCIRCELDVSVCDLHREAARRHAGEFVNATMRNDINIMMRRRSKTPADWARLFVRGEKL
jgi:hypothetical protein